MDLIKDHPGHLPHDLRASVQHAPQDLWRRDHVTTGVIQHQAHIKIDPLKETPNPKTIKFRFKGIVVAYILVIWIEPGPNLELKCAIGEI